MGLGETEAFRLASPAPPSAVGAWSWKALKRRKEARREAKGDFAC